MAHFAAATVGKTSAAVGKREKVSVGLAWRVTLVARGVAADSGSAAAVVQTRTDFGHVALARVEDGVLAELAAVGVAMKLAAAGRT